MAQRVEIAAEVDLDQIWVYVARESGSIDIATRFVESITDRFVFWPTVHTRGVRAAKTSGSAFGVSR